MLTETLNLPGLLHSLRERLAGALAGLPEHTGLVSVTLAMPELNGLRFSATDEMAVYWARPGEQQYLATSGTAVRLTACGGDRFLHLEQKFQHHLKSWLQQDPEKVGGGARAFLGFAFEARCGDRQSASAELFVPTVLLEQDGSTSRFVFTCYRPSSGPTVDAVPDWLRCARRI